MKNLIEKLWQIAKENPAGFTVSIPNCEPLKSGYCIGHRETQNSFGKKGLAHTIKIAKQNSNVVGGWKGYNGKFYFDAVIVTNDGFEALDLKSEHSQIAIYHLDTGRVL